MNTTYHISAKPDEIGSVKDILLRIGENFYFEFKDESGQSLGKWPVMIDSAAANEDKNNPDEIIITGIIMPPQELADRRFTAEYNAGTGSGKATLN